MKTKKAPPAKTKPSQVVGRLPEGTVVVRNYNGKDYRVKILANGAYEMDGKAFDSLTALAKEITKYPSISGPQFFKPAFEAATNGKK